MLLLVILTFTTGKICAEDDNFAFLLQKSGHNLYSNTPHVQIQKTKNTCLLHFWINCLRGSGNFLESILKFTNSFKDSLNHVQTYI